ADLKERSSSTSEPPPAAVRDPGLLFGRFARSPKPYVGRIAGHCVAGGMGLAAALDISIAAEDARFGFTEVRVGVAPAVISVVCLPKLRPADARAAFLRGRRFSAAEAASMGLINAAVPADRLDDEVDAVVTDLLAGGPGAIAAAKRLLAEVPGTPVDEAFRWTGELSAQLFATEEAREGMSAFLDKRRASWVPPAPEKGG
ncbi:MAG TPA: enoyl-CoA hydratase-related protein, partial [Pseudonocardiaceae bacterium]|nr:enoyl-CoA hydratase-related protein [Pseudonocardiaceae bacterium]